jgi:hypothetical protein
MMKSLYYLMQKDQNLDFSNETSQFKFRLRTRMRIDFIQTPYFVCNNCQRA